MSDDSTEEMALLTEALSPLPLSALSVLVLCNALSSKRSRAHTAVQVLKDRGMGAVSAADVAFAFDKLEQHLPHYLPPKVTQGTSALLEPMLHKCNSCGQDFDSHRKEYPLKVYSSANGITVGTAVERHCASCGTYFVGPWVYKRNTHGMVRTMHLTGDIDQIEFSVMFQGPRGASLIGMPVAELRRASAILHHARASFNAVAETMVEESCCPDMEKEQRAGNLAKRVILHLWVPFALAAFLTKEDAKTLEFSSWLGHAQNAREADSWLLSLRPKIRRRFVQKWLLEHTTVCPKCSVTFGLGLDGKRGMKRYGCACLEGPQEYVSFADTFTSAPCPELPLNGGLYCGLHDTSDAEGATDELSNIVDHRRDGNGTLEYRLCLREDDGSDSFRWIVAEEASKSLVRNYESSRLPERLLPGRNQKKKTRRKAGTGAFSATSSDADVFGFTEDDAGACAIDKSKQASGAHVAKHCRRRIGGIIAAVSGCRLFLDWREHQGGEGTSEVYRLLGECVAAITESIDQGGPGKLPDVVFMDNACTLRKYATNPRRSERTRTTRELALLRYIIDIWHVNNHHACLANANDAAVLDPRLPVNEHLRRAVNTEACEQAFSFLDRVTYVSYCMGPGMFHVYGYLIMDMENTKIMRRRR